ncbi:acyl-CoA dehydrogenase family protein [Trujillonella endophytica]|uniref:Acyl-CoA dehydrogenase, C-terminal domain n=1 Tax=Trujillonella endophytica TaxID=673521 RepID=A0A1H8V5Q9_9ACTN|nr:acyl-CoA dehydrogenase family protein [Trujillella endophytica]SEP10745.1 Acyl-CoA dehydrogenase, C-terminal domain [Trujillella endophytica]
MNTDLSPEATEFGREVLRALEAAGGDALVQQAEADPDRRQTVAAALADLGVWELDPRGDGDELEAAAAVARSCGSWAVPYPVAERLARPPDADGLVLVDEARPQAAVAGLGLRWAAVTLDGRRGPAVPREATAPPRTTAFVTGLDLGPLDDGGAGDRAGEVALALALPCWTLLGMLDRALALTREHVLRRTQFGRPLAALQGVQFQVADAEVERAGVEVLARYALWSIATGRPEAVADALALRSAAIDAADVVFRVAHQLHGASGFCDETQVSWLSRYSLPLRRLPFGPTATRERLTRALGRRGLPGPYGAAAALGGVR